MSERNAYIIYVFIRADSFEVNFCCTKSINNFKPFSYSETIIFIFQVTVEHLHESFKFFEASPDFFVTNNKFLLLDSILRLIINNFQVITLIGGQNLKKKSYKNYIKSYIFRYFNF